MKSKYILLFIFFVFLGLLCFNCNFNAQKTKLGSRPFEGYITVDIKVFAGVDSNGHPADLLQESDSTLLPTHRKLYLSNNLLIDIVGNKNFENGHYIKTDTLSYDFYDLDKQKYIHFEKFSPDAKIIKRGNMATDGSFSNTALYDPWNGVDDSVWKITDTVINERKQGIMHFITEISLDSTDKEFVKRSKYWVDHEIKNFPLQLSYLLSKKLNHGFIYKQQLPMPDGRGIMVTSLDYQPARLPDSLLAIFRSWEKKMD